MCETWVWSLEKIPWRRERLPTPVFWPGGFHGLYIVHGVAKSWTQLSNFHFHFLQSMRAGCLRINTPVSLPLKEKDWKYQLCWLSFLLYLLLIPSQSFLELFPKCTLLWCAKSHPSCPTFSDPIDYSLPGSSVPGILQARILEWVAIPSSRASSRSGDQIWISYVSCVGRQVLYHQRQLGRQVLYH